jgi:hypothetical protein
MEQNDIANYNNQAGELKPVCELLATEINKNLPESESKLWHGAPVWFLDGNPVAGYSQQKPGIRLMFWSGMSFDEPKLAPSDSGKFKDASIFYNAVDEINKVDLVRWLKKAQDIQWDYKNIVKRKGVLERLK